MKKHAKNPKTYLPKVYGSNEGYHKVNPNISLRRAGGICVGRGSMSPARKSRSAVRPFSLRSGSLYIRCHAVGVGVGVGGCGCAG